MVKLSSLALGMVGNATMVGVALGVGDAVPSREMLL